MSAHTPGPWVRFCDKGRTVSVMPAGRLGDVVNGTFSNEADALLIAAAPDLLQAAQEALHLIKGLKAKYEGGRGVYAGEEALARAVAKARGE